MRVLRAAWMVNAGILLTGCTMAEVPALVPAAQQLRAGKGDPEPGMQEIGPVEATNGSGCGAFGAEGTFEGATVQLKNQAAEMGADYVQIFTLTEPHAAPGCYDNRFVIRGVAFRGLAKPPRTVALKSSAPAATLVATTTPAASGDASAAPAISWPPLPADSVSGRAATQDDVKAGRAVFATQTDARILPVVVPQYAYCIVEGTQRPGIIVQAEEAFGMPVAGFRPLAGAKPAVAELRGCRLLGQTVPH